VGGFYQRQGSQMMLVCTQASALYFLEQLSMSKRTIVLQSAGSLLGLACLNLALAPMASAVPSTTNMSQGTGACTGVCSTNMSHGTGTNMSHGTGTNMSHGTGGEACTTTYGCGTNMSHGTGTNMSHGTGTNMSQGTGGECKTGKCSGGPGDNGEKNPFENGSTTSGSDPKRGDYIIGKDSVSQFAGGEGKGGSGYTASSIGLSKQMMALLNAAANAYAEASARLAAIQSQATPSAQKDTSVRYSRVADANADCGCNASAAAPDNSVELAAAKKAEAEAAASLAKAQQQAREFLEAQKKAGNNIANGTQFTPIW
jgi:hypothetical protein